MAWIKTVNPAEDPEVAAALAETREGYPVEYGTPSKEASRLPPAVRDESIVLAHSLLPKAMRLMMSGYREMLQPDLPLTRRQHEMIAATVSAINQCYY